MLIAIGNTGLYFFLADLYAPPPSPAWGAEETYAYLMERRTGILWLAIGMNLLAPFFYFFAVITSMQIKRIEGHFGLLSFLQLTTAVVAPTGWCYPLATLANAVYRPDRDPALIQLMNDQYWLTMVGVAFIFSLNIFIIGLAALLDRRKNPVFPRWFAYSNFFFALAFAPGVLIYAVQTGPMAWDGLFPLWIPSTVFPLWQISMVVCLLRAVKSEEKEEMEALALQAQLRTAPDPSIRV
ncbi:hypothetical protein LDO26_13195 [Luteimonas sp. BDR2-5]|uniref:hypothetical protein n=1 Tax=Proluteimonas luteida TaxID=2878685 RepID=UPI001E32A9B8|nr:hypothetical protein [Luteimonas sp. BDR2-5]MCD9029155.1 hypothetical protein [Luteimonas sp. BDR2-5]